MSAAISFLRKNELSETCFIYICFQMNGSNANGNEGGDRPDNRAPSNTPDDVNMDARGRRAARRRRRQEREEELERLRVERMNAFNRRHARDVRTYNASSSPMHGNRRVALGLKKTTTTRLGQNNVANQMNGIGNIPLPRRARVDRAVANDTLATLRQLEREPSRVSSRYDGIKENVYPHIRYSLNIREQLDDAWMEGSDSDYDEEVRGHPITLMTNGELGQFEEEINSQAASLYHMPIQRYEEMRSDRASGAMMLPRDVARVSHANTLMSIRVLSWYNPNGTRPVSDTEVHSESDIFHVDEDEDDDMESLEIGGEVHSSNFYEPEDDEMPSAQDIAQWESEMADHQNRIMQSLEDAEREQSPNDAEREQSQSSPDTSQSTVHDISVIFPASDTEPSLSRHHQLVEFHADHEGQHSSTLTSSHTPIHAAPQDNMLGYSNMLSPQQHDASAGNTCATPIPHPPNSSSLPLQSYHPRNWLATSQTTPLPSINEEPQPSTSGLQPSQKRPYEEDDHETSHPPKIPYTDNELDDHFK
jgi:hypothetical protein